MSIDADQDHLNRKLWTITLCALYRKTIRLACPKPTCGHARMLDAVPLWWLFHRRGWDDELPDALRHFRCDRCWSTSHAIQRPAYRISDGRPAGDQFDYPPESEWKRLVRRFRR